MPNEAFNSRPVASACPPAYAAKGQGERLTLKSEAAAERFIDAFPLIRPATFFGGVHSSAERRARWGDAVAPGFVRLSVGCEPVEELWGAIDVALDETGNALGEVVGGDVALAVKHAQNGDQVARYAVEDDVRREDKLPEVRHHLIASSSNERVNGQLRTSGVDAPQQTIRSGWAARSHISPDTDEILFSGRFKLNPHRRSGS